MTRTRGERAHDFFRQLQDEITSALAAADGGGAFHADEWQREGGGGGRSCVLEGGAVIERGGVNLSFVHGQVTPELAAQMPGSGATFLATGVSLIIHPRSPRVPTVHANFRYFERGEAAWYGGGSDLTPWILVEEDARNFHRALREVCARHPVVDHGRLKKWCDEYFFLPHRGETRGVGGIFFDHLGRSGHPRGIDADLDAAEAFVKDAGRAFLGAYLPIFERHKSEPFTDEERDWQLHRRGRYVEFNLIYDRGTIFGLKSGGRIESILVSLPSIVRWSYQKEPAPGWQSELVSVLRSPRDWLADG